jgi:hypothetical protein
MTARPTHRLALVAVALVPAGGCLEDVPAQPSWQVDIMPIIQGNCVRCHGSPALNFATVRLDMYGPIPAVGGGDTKGAGDAQIARNIVARTDPGEFDEAAAMPPGRTLGLYEIETLRNWVALSGVGGPPRGAGNPDNRAPTATVAELARDAAAGTLTYSYDVVDADANLVVGWIGLVSGASFTTLSDQVTGGRGEVALDVAAIAAGTYDLVLRLDDGADVDGPEGEADYVEVPLGSLALPLVPQ